MTEQDTRDTPTTVDEIALGLWTPSVELSESDATAMERHADLLSRMSSGWITDDAELVATWREQRDYVDWGALKSVNSHYQQAMYRQIFFNVLENIAPQVQADLLGKDDAVIPYKWALLAFHIDRHYAGHEPLSSEVLYKVEKGLTDKIETWKERWNLKDDWCGSAARQSLSSAGIALMSGDDYQLPLRIDGVSMSEKPYPSASVLGHLLMIDTRDFDPANTTIPEYLTQKYKSMKKIHSEQLERRTRISGTSRVSGKFSHSEKFRTLIEFAVLKTSPSEMVAEHYPASPGHVEPKPFVDPSKRQQVYKDCKRYADEIGLSISKV